MSDFPDEEPDPEMTEDHEENAPGLEEALEEIFRVPQILPALLVKKVENVVPFAHSRLALQKRSKRETNAANARADLQCTLSKVLLCLHPKSAFS